MKNKVAYSLSFIAIVAFLACVFGYYFLCTYIASGVGQMFGVLSYAPAVISYCLFCYAIVKAVPMLEDFWGTVKSKLDLSDSNVVYACILIWILFMSGITVALALGKNPSMGFFQALDNAYDTSIDVHHYFDIAKKWYQNDDTDQRLFIVFFPLYPVLLRIVHFFVGNYTLSGIIINAFAVYFGGVLFYKLCLKFLTQKQSLYALKYLLIFPSAFFFFVPMTESLFLLLSVGTIYFMTERKYLLAALFGFLAALTRSVGLVLLVPMFCELVYSFRKDYLNGVFNVKKAVTQGLCLAAVPLGFFVYLFINWIIYANPFQFLIYQREHWGQQMDFFWNTARYLVEYFWTYYKNGQKWLWMGLSVPSIIAFFGGLIIIAYGANKIRVSLTLYSLTYFMISMGPTWLLSAPRYILCLFPLAAAVGIIAEKKKIYDRLLTCSYLLMFVIYFHFFIVRYPVY